MQIDEDLVEEYALYKVYLKKLTKEQLMDWIMKTDWDSESIEPIVRKCDIPDFIPSDAYSYVGLDDSFMENVILNTFGEKPYYLLHTLTMIRVVEAKDLVKALSTAFGALTHMYYRGSPHRNLYSFQLCTSEYPCGFIVLLYGLNHTEYGFLKTYSFEELNEYIQEKVRESQ